MASEELAHALRMLLRHPQDTSVRARAEATLRDYDIGQKRTAERRKTIKRLVMPVEVATGHSFPSVRAAWVHAKTLGYDGSVAAFTQRVKKGGLTWEQLIAPVDPEKQARRRRAVDAQRAEMHEVVKGMQR